MVLWVRIPLGRQKYLRVMDTGATISIVARKPLPPGDVKNILTTAAICMGDGDVLHSCGDWKVDVPMGSWSIARRSYLMDTEAFNILLGTDFSAEHPHILSLTLQAPYVLPVDYGDGRNSSPLVQSEHTLGYVKVCKKERSAMMVASNTGDYQLLGGVLDQGLK